MALLLLPFDDYEDSPPKDSILDHPHWLSLALMVAHSIAQHSMHSLVMVPMLLGVEMTFEATRVFTVGLGNLLERSEANSKFD